MIDGKEVPQSFSGAIINKENIHSLDQLAISPTLRFEPEILAFKNWKEMLNRTQADNRERGISVGISGKKIFESKIITGAEEEISSPFLPYGIKSLIPVINEIVNIHTHLKSPDLKTPTTIFSDKDVNAFLASSLKALVMIDTGGVHMLARVPYSSYSLDPETEKSIETVRNAIKIANENRRLIEDVRREVAEKLQPLGIRYYYSSDLENAPDGLIELTDVLK